MAKGRKTGGRKAGTPNKRTGDGADQAERLITDRAYLEGLQARLCDGTVSPQVEVLLWHLVYGKPAERQIITGDPETPLVVNLVQYAAD